MSQADVDLKGNTNFVVLKDLNDEIVVPRTNLAAVDITVANGIKVAGSTLYADLASVSDVSAGTLGSLVDASVLNTVLQGKVDTDYSTVKESIDGTPVKPASNDSIKSALSVAKAVDVTSAPNASAGTLTYTSLRGTITWAASAAGAVNIGFYDSGSSFPKFADGLAYILVADVKNTGNAALTLSFGGTDILDAAGSLPAGESKRIGIVFTTATSGYFSFTAVADSSLEITNLREFEVTGCTNDARKYIAELSNPDDFTKFYLVDYDEQNPWTYIIDMHDSPAVTLMAGLAYKLNATTGTHTLTTDVCPAGYYGEDAHLKLFVGAGGNVVFQSPLNLIDGLTPNAGHNITIKYRDGQANAYVDDTDIGAVITVNSGTTAGSLYYALGTDNSTYLVFANTTNGTPVDLEGVTANVGEKYVNGNGADQTFITGSGSFTKKTVFNNLSMKDAVVVGGTMTMDGASVASGASVTAGTNGTLLLANAYVPEGGTVLVDGGNLTVEKVDGNGGVIDLGGTHMSTTSPQTVLFGGTTVTSGLASYGGGYQIIGDIKATISGGVFFKCSATSQGGGIETIGSGNIVDGCIFSACSATSRGGGFSARNKNVTLRNCVFRDNLCPGMNTTNAVAFNDGGVANCVFVIDGGDFGTGQSVGCHFGNSASVIQLKGIVKTLSTIGPAYNGAVGGITISSGAIIDLTGNTNATPINPGGGITFAPGGATVYPSAGQASSYVLGGMTVPRIGNTNVVDLNGSQVIIAQGTTASASGCTFTNGSNAIRNNGGSGYLTSCTLTNNNASYGAAIYATQGGLLQLIGCTVTGNTYTYGDIYAQNGATISVVGGTFGSIVLGNAGVLSLNGSIILNKVEKLNNQNVGSVVISSGAKIVLTNAQSNAIVPGGAITLYCGSGASATYLVTGGNMSRFYKDADRVVGSTITNGGIIYGATVYFPSAENTYEVGYTTDSGTTYQTVDVTGTTEYVVTGALMSLQQKT